MTGKKKKILWGGISILTLTILIIAQYVYDEIGSLYSDKESVRQFSHYSYYNTLEHQFISPEPLAFYPERTTGGDVGFGRFFKKSPYAPRTEIPKIQLKKADFSLQPSSYAIYWLGHSSAILEIDGLRILIDPVLENAAPFPGVASRYTSSPITHKELPDMDIVLITHDHYDHLEAKTMRYLKNSNSQFIVPSGVSARLKGWGISPDKITEMGWDQTLTFSSVQIIAFPTIHYSGRSGKDRNKTLWTGYTIKGKDKNIFWSGDSGYGEYFKTIGETYGPFDLACVEIDGWNDGWPNTHLYPEEVIAVCHDIQATVLLPVHWGVFDLALHPWNESIQKVYEAGLKNNIEVLTPLIGQKVIPGETQTDAWW